MHFLNFCLVLSTEHLLFLQQQGFRSDLILLVGSFNFALYFHDKTIFFLLSFARIIFLGSSIPQFVAYIFQIHSKGGYFDR